MAKTTIYLVRHGQSVGNLNNTMLGHTDLDLSEVGYKQAQITAEALREVNFDAIYSSDLVRARNTALYHAKMRNFEVRTDTDFRELDVGDWENQSIEKLQKEFETDFFVGWIQNFGTFTFPNGESVLGGGERFYSALEKLAKAHEGEQILLATHAAVIRAFWGIVLGLPCEKWATDTKFPTNASYSVVEYDEGKFTPVSFSNDKHLGEFVTALRM